ncbi:hypothetical protein BDW75DRAFT_98470 [Aspergillus navahoensis]
MGSQRTGSHLIGSMWLVVAYISFLRGIENKKREHGESSVKRNREDNRGIKITAGNKRSITFFCGWSEGRTGIKHASRVVE